MLGLLPFSLIRLQNASDRTVNYYIPLIVQNARNKSKKKDCLNFTLDTNVIKSDVGL